MNDQERKELKVFTGFLKYFPKAIKEVTKASLAGNKQHLNGEELFWDRTKSKAHTDSMTRHLLDVAEGIEMDDDGVLHRAKIAWRAMADLEVYLENNPIPDTKE